MPDANRPDKQSPTLFNTLWQLLKVDMVILLTTAALAIVLSIPYFTAP